MMRAVFVSVQIICVFSLCAAEAAERGMPPHPSVVNQRKAVPREFVFTLSAGKTENDLRTFLSEWGVASLRALSGRLFLVRLDRDVSIDELRAAARGSSVVERVQPNYRYRTGPGEGPVR